MPHHSGTPGTPLSEPALVGSLAPETERDSARTSELSVPESLALAMNLHRSSQLGEARELYLRILADAPECAEAWHFLGLLDYQEGRHEPGIDAVRRSLSLSPDYADAHANFANMLIVAERFDEAENHLDQALRLTPDAAPPRIALAMIYRARGRACDAEALVRPALERNPDSGALRYALGNALLAQDKHEEALEHFLRAVVLRPDIAEGHRALGRALGLLGRLDEAAAYYRAILENEPDNVEYRHLLAACGGAEAPPRATDDYVRAHFDGFARSFDVQLARLEYRAPELIAEACRQALRAPDRQYRVLDAGCGTGLLGPLLRPWSAHLSGVDLSPGMLEHAIQRGVYEQLVEGELCAHLEGRHDALDVIASADTLCYFGALEDFARRALLALVEGGWLMFTVEDGATQAADYALQINGRYAHRRDYVVRVLESAGFAEIRIAAQTLRMEAAKPVAGLVIATQKGVASCQ